MTMLATTSEARVGLIMRLAGWLLACTLLALTITLAPLSGGLARPFFVLGCIVVSAYAWRQNAGAHLQAMLVLFFLCPLRPPDGRYSRRL